MTTLSDHNDDTVLILTETRYLVSFHNKDNSFLVGITYDYKTEWNSTLTLTEAVIALNELLFKYTGLFTNEVSSIFKGDQLVLKLNPDGYVEFGPLYNANDTQGIKFWKTFETFHPSKTGRNRPFFMG